MTKSVTDYTCAGRTRQKQWPARAFRGGGASCLLASPLETCAVPVDHFSYPTRTRSRWCLPVRTRTQLVPKISTPDYIGTYDSHNFTAKAMGIPLPSSPMVQVSYGPDPTYTRPTR